mmetsp:Transcript_16406/g.28416  ORF Transcript_16406/g.28416 Transcript_16406/m.28416 type:complete len:214 (+) Transcript_16406:260-901(+)
MRTFATGFSFRWPSALIQRLSAAALTRHLSLSLVPRLQSCRVPPPTASTSPLPKHCLRSRPSSCASTHPRTCTRTCSCTLSSISRLPLVCLVQLTVVYLAPSARLSTDSLPCSRILVLVLFSNASPCVTCDSHVCHSPPILCVLHMLRALLYLSSHPQACPQKPPSSMIVACVPAIFPVECTYVLLYLCCRLPWTGILRRRPACQIFQCLCMF